MFLTLITAAVALTIPQATAQNTTLYIDPQQTQAFPTDTITITIKIENVTNLNAWQIALKYNPTTINCTQVTIPPDNIFAGHTTISPNPIIDNNNGLVVKFTALDTTTGITGSGNLVQIQFKALNPGTSPLELINPNQLINGTYLQDPDGNFIPFQRINATATIYSPETTLTIPFHTQEKTYYSGPAALQMIFDHYGEPIPQQEIAEAARTHPNITYPDELRRAAHFSNLSTSKGDEMPENITGYTLRKYGYGAIEKTGLTLNQLKDTIRQGYPVIVSTWYDLSMQQPHYRVAVGYNETHIFLHDPWNKTAWGGTYGGPKTAINNTEFQTLWSYSSNLAIFVHPWNLTCNIQLLEPDLFLITANITYPTPQAFANQQYTASSATAQIILPDGTTLVEGNPSEPINSGTFTPGSTTQINWTVKITTPGRYTITVRASGTISGNVSSHETYPNYTYQDKLQAEDTATIECWNPNTFTASKNGQQYTVIIYSNSTISDFQYNETLDEITFTASGPDGTTGTCLVSIPKAFMNTSYFVVTVNATLTANQVTQNATHSFVNFHYHQSTQQIRLIPTGPGDLNGDRRVNMRDIALVARAFGSSPGIPNWNPIADINGDEKVNMRDIGWVAKYFGVIYS